MSGEKYKSWNHQLEWMSRYPSLSDHQGDQQAWIQPNKQRKPTEAAKHVHLMITQLPSSAPSFIIYRYKISLMFLSRFFFLPVPNYLCQSGQEQHKLDWR